MASFNAVPTIATKRDVAAPVSNKPSNTITDEDLVVKQGLTDEEAEEKLSTSLLQLVEEEAKPEPVIEEPKVEPEVTEPKVEEEPVKKEEVPESKPKKVVVTKEEPAPVVEEAKAEEEPKEPARPLTPEEKKAKQLENLRKAREAAQARKERENAIMAAKETAEKKPVAKPKKAVDMSKMMTVTKKPAAGGKTCYHVSKRGETAADRVWKVFIQESNKVIKLFDTQAEALEYAKQLAKNKADGSYVILHGLDGKIRKY